MRIYIKLTHLKKKLNLLKLSDFLKNFGTLKANNNKVKKIITSGLLQLRKAIAIIRFIINN
jgi:hypothetical protein